MTKNNPAPESMYLHLPEKTEKALQHLDKQLNCLVSSLRTLVQVVAKLETIIGSAAEKTETPHRSTLVVQTRN